MPVLCVPESRANGLRLNGLFPEGPCCARMRLPPPLSTGQLSLISSRLGVAVYSGMRGRDSARGVARPVPGSGAALLRFIFGGQRDKSRERHADTGTEEGGGRGRGGKGKRERFFF